VYGEHGETIEDFVVGDLFHLESRQRMEPMASLSFSNDASLAVL
jgi:hypothetical protein